MNAPSHSLETNLETAITGMITFLYYKDLPTVAKFYEEVLGLELVIDQGFAKIYKVAGDAHIGIVDETRGYHKANPIKPVEITLLVTDVDAWYKRVLSQGVTTLTEPRDLVTPHLRMFLMQDPEGYVIEIQKFL